MANLRLKPGREKPLLRRHPWIFSGAVAEISGEIEPGGTIKITSNKGEFLAWAAYSPQSNITARVWSWEEDVRIDKDFIRDKIRIAVTARENFPGLKGFNGYRLIHSEGDGLPGLIVDRYGDTLVVQLLTQGAAFWREEIAESLINIPSTNLVYERSEGDSMDLEGLPPHIGTLRGQAKVGPVIIQEHGLNFLIDIKEGQKTGFYLDQRANRLKVREWAKNKRVLDCFCYTGGFSLNALKGGATDVIAIDSSRAALIGLEENLTANGFEDSPLETKEGDVFKLLRTFRDMREEFDLIILDPPKFAKTKAHVDRAARGYKDINLLALKLLRPGGVLVSFSCSGGITPALFQKILAGAALDAGVDLQIVERLNQDVDHPVLANFPEGDYLKGIIGIKRT